MLPLVRLLFLAALLLVVAAAWLGWRQWGGGDITDVQPPPLTTISPAPQAALSALVITEKEGQSQVITCTDQRCIPQPRPDALDGEAVFDGEGWLYYQETESTLSKLTKKILLRAVAGKITQLMEQTPLTSPRDLIISPTGKHTVFFLDNIDRPEANLTELWAYDREKNGVRLLVEKLYQPDIRSRVRWNRSGTYLWFMADTGAQDNPRDVLELVVVPLSGTPAAAFKHVAWGKLAEIIDEGVMDIAPSGKEVAYVAPRLFGREELVVVKEGSSPHRISVKGTINYLQFLEDDSLVYSVQDGRGVTFWRLRDLVQRHIARQPGQLLSAHADPVGDFVALVAQVSAQTPAQLLLLHTPTGAVTPKVSTGISEGAAHLTNVQIQPVPSATPASDTGGTLDDAQLAAFIDAHFPRIAGESGSKPQRLVITDQANTVFVDYTSRSGQEERLLLVVHDVAHADWAIKGRYQIQRAEWHKVQGGGLPDPNPVRLYEWEESVGQWILKQEVGNRT